MAEENGTKSEPKAKEPELPKGIKDLLDEQKRVEKKLEEAKKLAKAGDSRLSAISEVLDGLKNKVVDALVKESQNEVEQARKNAEIIAAGGQPPGVVAMGDDQLRIKEAEDEMQRIRDKVEKAKEYGAPSGITKPILDQVGRLTNDLEKAALAAAERELDQLKKDIVDLRKGKPRKPKDSAAGPGKPKDPKDGGTEGKGDKGGAGAAGGATQDARLRIDFGIPKDGLIIGDGGTLKDPGVTPIYVRSDRKVWAWDRYEQGWALQAFSSDLVEVKLIKGGILAIAEHGAALFDATMGDWLPALDSGTDVLTGGNAPDK